MNLKTAAMVALIGTTLLTVLLIAGLVNSLVAFSSGVLPSMTLLTSFIHAFAALSLAIFFYSFQQAQR